MTTEIHQLTLKTIRVLIADLVQQFNGGHPGGAMDMAAIGVALWKYVLEFSPNNPDYFNRDRFVLSNGHTCLFQYVFLHLSGYKNVTLDQLKTYHSSEVESYCPGHPENEHPGIEVTTGALGQGISNSVGLAVAAKHLGATYNRPDFEVVSNQTFCMVGDACLQEGVSLEAISLAGHLGLDNLTVIYDNNQVSCDGTVDITNTENINEKFKATNWNVIEIQDGSYDIDSIVKALKHSKFSRNGKPTLINVHTKIGIGSKVEGQAAAHGAAFGNEEVERLHTANGFDPNERFNVPKEVYEFFGDLPSKGDKAEKSWRALLNEYAAKYPEEYKELKSRIDGKLPENWQSYIPSSFPTTPTPSRKSSGLVFNPIAKNVNSFLIGCADLSPSVNLYWDSAVDFQNPTLKSTCGQNGNYTGRYIHYGIREHAMAAIANGIAAYNKNTIIPVTSTFFMFYLYAAPAVRYGALSELKVIHVATHDSIGIGEDGPTHQPIALASFYRAVPNLLYIRPCDSNETAGAWEAAIKLQDAPAIISLSRHSLTQYPQYSRRDLVSKGAYIFVDAENPEIQLFGIGAEMEFAVKTHELLKLQGIRSRVISFPSQRLFEAQPIEYKRQILQRGKIPSVVIEAYSPVSWERYATAGYNMLGFGKSLPGPDTYKFFGFDAEVIATRVTNYLDLLKQSPDLLWDFQDLNPARHRDVFLHKKH